MIKVMDYNAEDSEVTEIQNIICQIAEAEKVEKETAEKEVYSYYDKRTTDYVEQNVYLEEIDTSKALILED